MQDCNQVKKKINNTRLAYKNLMDLVTEYNSCFDSKEKGYKATKPLAKLRTGPVIGIGYSPIKFYATSSDYNYLSKSTFKTSGNIVLGWLINTTLPKINEKVSLQVEALYTSNNYSSHYEEKVKGDISDTIFRYDISIRMKYAKLPIQIRYTYPKGKIRPYIQAGIYMAYIASSKNHMIREVEYRGVVATQEKQAVMTKAFQQGAIAALGMQTIILTKPTFFEVRIERGNGINTTSLPPSYPYSRNINVSFIYSIGF
jgi:hypothetical protein